MEDLICRVNSPKYKYLKISVYLVHRCNFNDEFLIAGESIELGTLKDKELVWLDPYLGKGKNEEKRIALISSDDANLTLRIKKGCEVSEETSELIIYISDDYDETYIISAHISLSNYKI